MSSDGAGSIDEAVLEDVSAVVDRRPVRFAMCFGSAARGTATATSDVDLAVEFDSHRPADDGYSDVLLALRRDLEETLDRPVDVVDVHAMPPTFASVAFDHGVVVHGSERRRDELEARLAGDAPTVAEARGRIEAAVGRLREDSRG